MSMDTFQNRVLPWLHACFGPEIASDKAERNHRFIEEALELVQSTGCTQSEAHQLVDYVYGRPVGEPEQEVGGVMNTLAALCLAHGMDMHECGETELDRVWTKVEAIRAKQAAKPKHSPLPQHVSPSETWDEMKNRHALEKAEAVMALEARGMTQAEAARVLDMPPVDLNNFVKRNGLTWRVVRQGFASRDPESLSPFGLNNPPAGERMQ